MALNGLHDILPILRKPAEGCRLSRLVIDSQVALLDLLDDLTGNVIAGYDSSGSSVASVALASATPTARRGAGNYTEATGN